MNAWQMQEAKVRLSELRRGPSLHWIPGGFYFRVELCLCHLARRLASVVHLLLWVAAQDARNTALYRGVLRVPQHN